MPASRTTYARLQPPARGPVSWWGRAWMRAVEEAAYGERDLRRGKQIARRAEVGAISVGAGSVLAAVRAGDDAWTVEVAAPVQVVAAEAGRVAALLAGELPHDLVEHAEELGVELLPYGAELAATCTCPHVLDPCPHALAVLVQAGWLVESDPLALFAVRGLDRETLLGELHARATRADDLGPAAAADLADDVELAADAVLRARRLAELLEAGAEIPEGLL